MQKKRTLKVLSEITGGLSKPSKMPGFGWSISAYRCKTGERLREVPNSTCASCYACKGRYAFGVVQQALERRYQAMVDGLVDGTWVAAMVETIAKRQDKKEGKYFRWHDSGDLQNISHLRAIVEVARLTPRVRHWLPTREYSIVRGWIDSMAMSSAGYDEWSRNGGGTGIPSNLCIRLSAHMVDGKAPSIRRWLPTSTVHKESPAVGYECPAPKQGGVCHGSKNGGVDCDACWNVDVANISYGMH